jgi:hypothetical protein
MANLIKIGLFKILTLKIMVLRPINAPRGLESTKRASCLMFWVLAKSQGHYDFIFSNSEWVGNVSCLALRRRPEQIGHVRMVNVHERPKRLPVLITLASINHNHGCLDRRSWRL